MALVRSLVLMTLVSPSLGVDLFAFERTQLDRSTDHISARSDFASPAPKCKAFPGVDWPSEEAWSELNTAVNGALLKPAPAASVCYNSSGYGNYNAAACANLTQGWATELVRMDHPIEVVSPMFQGLTCLPPSEVTGSSKNMTKTCIQGGYPAYVMDASTVADVQAAVNFARSQNVRLVIKNTGHDLSGKSLGAGSLSIWTHHLRGVQFLANYTAEDGNYTGPAFKVGAGVQAAEILKVASENKHMVVTGICDSVGIFGGYSLGGGHSPLSSLHGMGADQVLSLNVVTADGQFRIASPTENTDLFWALRGGGGSTFGVVTSMIVKAFPDAVTSVATFDWGVRESNISNDTFWAGVALYFGRFAEFTDKGLSAQFFIYPQETRPQSALPDARPRFSVTPFFGVGKTLKQLKNATEPWIDDMATLGINITTTWHEFESYYPAFYSQLAPTSTGVMPYNMTYGSRLIPKSSFNSTNINSTVQAYRSLAEQGHMFNGFQLSPSVEKGAPVGGGNAVLPAWRDALSHTIVFALWDQNLTPEQQMSFRNDFATGRRGMKLLRDVTPGSGSYMSESDRLEPNFQEAFFGSNYERLLEIKHKVDPQGVFFASTGVGSEEWTVQSVDGLPTENGRLCQL